ncbi:MAG: single-stranded-DNA-specific exonuclease RecJ [Armatimonadota bacterium]
MPPDEAGRRRLSETLGMTPLVAQALINRGLGDPLAAAPFLAPRLDRLHDPFALIDMPRAVERLARAVRLRMPIVVYGDYDADGVTAAAIMVRGLRRLGAVVDVYIPERRTEGYGLHAAAVERLAQQGAALVVAVDCGVTASAAGEAARAGGVDLIILDHHEPIGTLPHAAAIVDPKRQAPVVADYCAAGLAYQTCQALFATLGVPDPPEELIALAAVGTVADAVRLIGDNRILVAAGLDRLGRPSIAGLDALAAVAAVRPPVRARDLSHGLAPRLNAAGRLAHAFTALRLLTTDDAGEAQQLAAELDRLNQERRALCDAVLADAIDEVERDGLDRGPAIVLARPDWHPGVIGIVASQLVERYHRPAVLIALDGALGRGSARSITPLNLVDAIGACAVDLTAYGGHAMAAGLTVDADAVPRFTDAFVREVGSRLRPEDLEPAVAVDAEVELRELTPRLAGELERLAPFGNGNPEPVFLTRRLRAVGTRLVGDGAHLRLLVSDGAQTAEVIAFRGGDRVELLAFTQARIDLAYTVEIDRWREDERVQLVAAAMDTPDVDLAAVTSDTGVVLDRLFARADDYLGPRLRDVEQAPAFHTKVVGVTFDGRQEILPMVPAGARLQLARDPNNTRDPHAIKVMLDDGRQLGFLSAVLAARLAPSMDAGARYAATATVLTGGGDRAWGLNIYVERESGWGGDDRAAPQGRRGTAGPDIGERLIAGFYRGRPPGPVIRGVLNAARENVRAVAAIGPGRGLLPAVVMAAAVRLAASARPAVVVLPRAATVDAWFDLAAPWLRDIGIRAAAAHGLLPSRAAGRLAVALGRGAIDLLFASIEWTDRQAPAAGAVLVVLDALAGDDLKRMAERFGQTVCLVAGSMSPAAAKVAQDTLGLGRVIVDSRTRDHLRIVDRRNRAGDGGADVTVPDGAAAGSPARERAPGGRAGGRPEKTLILTVTPEESVAVARRLRAEHSQEDAQLAYYHAGLPASLRRVLEDLFAAGRLTTLVAGSHLVDPAVPPDVTHLAVLGLCPERLLFAESLAAAGGNRRTAVIELRYGAGAVAAAQSALEARCPARETLARYYRALKAASGGRPWTWPEGPPPDLPEAAVSPEASSAALELLIEAGAVGREPAGGSDVRYSLHEGGRVDLTTSLRYREGERERAAWVDLRAWATGPAARILADLAGA